MLTAEQLAMRRTGIGGSDIAAIAGLDEYRSPLDVWLSVTGRAEPFSGNQFTHWGNRLESVIADEYAERNAVVLRPSGTRRHKSREWMIGTPDRLAFESARSRTPRWGVEIKARSTRQSKKWGDDGSSQVPEAVAAQCYWYMALAELPRWDVAVLIGGNDFRSYRLNRDEDIIVGLVELGRRFWTDHVCADIPPPVDGSSAWAEYVERLKPSHSDEILVANSDGEALMTSLAAVRSRIAAAEAEEETLKNHLKLLIGDAAGIEGEAGRCTWKRTKSGGTDWKALALKLGATKDDIAAHAEPGARRFMFTANGED